MFFLGHMGIGSKIVQPFAGKAGKGAGLPRFWVLLGTVLPDLLDKSIFYGLSFLTNGSSPLLQIFPGTRGVGHSAIFVLVIGFFGMFARSRVAAALALGIASHLVLDGISDSIGPDFTGDFQVRISALFWPITSFPAYPYTGMDQHLGTIGRPVIWICEILGAVILAWDFWKSNHRREIATRLRERWHKIRPLLKIERESE